MRMRVSLLLVVFFVFTQGNFVFAASTNAPKGKAKVTLGEIQRWASISHKLTREYDILVNDIRLGRADVNERMRSLRAYYPYTPYYDPFSKNLLDQMTRYAYTVDTSEDRAAVNDALDKYRELVYNNLAHLDVVSYALTLSRVDVRFGDEFFFRKVRDSIRNSWDGMIYVGSSPDDAYKVITYAEQTYILSTHGAKANEGEIFNVDKQFYDVREIVTEDDESLQLFFDLTTPIRTVQVRQALREKENKITIPLQ